MKKVLITGASGMVGGIVLKRCLESSEVSSVISLVRKPTGKVHDKLTEVIHLDFADYSDALNHFSGIDAAYFCIGAYTGSVPDDLFRKITVDFSITFGDALKAQSPEATMCFLSGQGADRTEKSRISFAKYKGIAENHLIEKKFKALYIFRPGYIYPVTKRQEPNLSYRIFRRLYPLMKTIYSSGVITSEELAGAMFHAGLKGAHMETLENKDIKKVVA